MKTPLEILESELELLRIIASQKGFSNKKRCAKKLIPQFEYIIDKIKNDIDKKNELLLSYHRFLQDFLCLDLNEIWVKEFLKDENYKSVTP